MLDWAKDNWDKLLSIAVAVVGAIFAVYHKVIGIQKKTEIIETKLEDHISDDENLKLKLDKLIDRMDKFMEHSASLNLSVASHEIIIKETREDIKELREDVRFLIRRNLRIDNQDNHVDIELEY